VAGIAEGHQVRQVCIDLAAKISREERVNKPPRAFPAMSLGIRVSGGSRPEIGLQPRRRATGMDTVAKECVPLWGHFREVQAAAERSRCPQLPATVMLNVVLPRAELASNAMFTEGSGDWK
jgi:hypothetical protein